MNSTIKTFILFGILSGIMMSMGTLLGGSSGLAIAAIISGALIFFQYFYSEKMALSSARATPLDNNQYASIYTMVKDLCLKMNMPMPRLWITQDSNANAFATGRSPTHASMVFTTGIVTMLSDNELKGVIAHELSHIKNRDILLMSCACFFVNLLNNLGFLMRMQSWSNNDNNKQSRSPIILIIIALLAPFLATLTQLAISREREYQADESGALISKDPLALAHALEKIELSMSTQQERYQQHPLNTAGLAPLCIINSLQGISIKTLFSTHPSTASRIARLQQINKKLSLR